MQGALAYARDRKNWSVPVSVVNLEVIGQSGGYVLRVPTAPALNRDAFAFLHQGIPATTLGSFDLDLSGRGFHSAMDNPGRMAPERLAEAVTVLSRLLADLDDTDERPKAVS